MDLMFCFMSFLKNEGEKNRPKGQNQILFKSSFQISKSLPPSICELRSNSMRTFMWGGDYIRAPNEFRLNGMSSSSKSFAVTGTWCSLGV